MAESSQYPLQIMENRTGFDLNASVESWRQEMAAQAPLSADDRRELETHLRDSFADLKSRGLKDDEAFWLARRRVGNLKQLAEEFDKADPNKVWRDRLFWMTFTLLLIRLWGSLINSVLGSFYLPGGFPKRVEDVLPQWVLFYLPNGLREFHYAPYFQGLIQTISFLLIPALVIFVLRGKVELARSCWKFASKTRLRFVSLIMLLTVIDSAISNLLWNALTAEKYHRILFTFYPFEVFYTCSLIALAVWLIPIQNQKTLKKV
jgi:hypothetical protein